MGIELCGCSSVVERHLPMVNVVGSSPFTRLFFKKTVHFIDICQFICVGCFENVVDRDTKKSRSTKRNYSTVTDLARLRG
ncbi:MAG: hypothetical protein RLZZ135_252 [Cyanobacteriota bacterium]